MALYAFDGTGQDDFDGDASDSNVAQFFNAYVDPLRDNDPDDARGSLYLKGIGRMAQTIFGDKVAEAFGIGGHHRIRQAMRRLRNNVRAGDRVIDVVGFSRGAGLAVSFANEVKEDHPDLRIRFMGVWDIVGQFGLPGERLQAGHDLSCPRNVDKCFHAMALDEDRLLFPLTRLLRNGKAVDGFTEVWFRGVHSDVGGGNGNRGINWLSLHWMFKAGLRSGLPIDPAAVAKNLALGSLACAVKPHDVAVGPPRNVFGADLVHLSVFSMSPHRPKAPELLCARIDDEGLVVKAGAGT